MYTTIRVYIISIYMAMTCTLSIVVYKNFFVSIMYIMNTRIISLYRHILFYNKLFIEVRYLAPRLTETSECVHDKREYYCVRYHHAQYNIIMLLLFHRCQCEKRTTKRKDKTKKKIEGHIGNIIYSTYVLYRNDILLSAFTRLMILY